MRPPYLFSIPLQFRSNHFKPPYHLTPLRKLLGRLDSGPAAVTGPRPASHPSRHALRATATKFAGISKPPTTHMSTTPFGSILQTAVITDPHCTYESV